jgi:hypothetical protein
MPDRRLTAIVDDVAKVQIDERLIIHRTQAATR